MFSTAAYAQDFPFYPGVPSWNQPYVPPLVPGTGGYTTGGTAWGPVQLFDVHQGDTVVFDYVLDWWGLVPVGTSPMTDNGENMRLEYCCGVDNQNQWGHGQLGYWCLRCEFRFEAGRDFPVLWIDYTGGDAFGAHLEIKQVIPAPRSLFSGPDKQTAQSWRDAVGGATGLATVFAKGYCDYVAKDRICSAASLGSAIGGAVTAYLAKKANDPWDDYYQYPFDPQIHDPSDYGWYWTDDSDVNELIYAATVIAAYSEAGAITIDRASTCLAQYDGCVDWQADRLRSMQWILGVWTQDAAARLAIMRDQTNDAGDYDSASQLDQIAQQLWGAGDYLQQ